MISPQGTPVNDVMAQIIAKLSFLKEDKYIFFPWLSFLPGYIAECFTLSWSYNKIIPRSLTDVSPDTIKKFEKLGSFQNS